MASRQVDLSGCGQHLCDQNAAPAQFPVKGRTGPPGLKEFKDLIVADLHVASACLCQECGIRAVQHFHGILLVLDTEAELKARVRPDIAVDRPGRPLRCEDQMYTEASSDLGDRDQLLHELRLLPFKLRELVDNDEQMLHWLIRLPRLIKRSVRVDPVHTVLGKDPLSAVNFTVDRDHGPIDLISGEIGDCSDHMGQTFEQICHSAALIVDDKEAHVLRAVVDSQRKDIGLQRLGLTGACRTRDKAVGTVILFVQVEITGPVASLKADQRFHGTRRIRQVPPLRRIQRLRSRHAVHIEEGEHIRDLAVLTGLRHTDISQRFGKPCHTLRGDLVEFDLLTVLKAVVRVGNAVIGTVHDALALIGEALHHIREENRGQSEIRFPLKHKVRDDRSLDKTRVRDDHNILRLRDPAVSCAVFLHSVPEDLRQRVEHVAGLVRVRSDIADLAVFRPDMREPVHEIPCVPVNIAHPVIDEGKLYIRITVRRHDLCDQCTNDIDGLAAALFPDDTDQMLLADIQKNGDIGQLLKMFPDLPRLIRQLVVDHHEAFLRNNDFLLKIHGPHSDAVAHEIGMGRVAVPEDPRVFVQITAALRIAVKVIEISLIIGVLHLEITPDICQIVLIAPLPVGFAFSIHAFLVPHIFDGPEDSDTGRCQGHDNTRVHKSRPRRSARVGEHDGHERRDEHGERHGKGRTDPHKKRHLRHFMFVRRCIDLDLLRMKDRHDAGCAVEFRDRSLFLLSGRR